MQNLRSQSLKNQVNLNLNFSQMPPNYQSGLKKDCGIPKFRTLKPRISDHAARFHVCPEMNLKYPLWRSHLGSLARSSRSTGFRRDDGTKNSALHTGTRSCRGRSTPCDRGPTIFGFQWSDGDEGTTPQIPSQIPIQGDWWEQYHHPSSGCQRSRRMQE